MRRRVFWSRSRGQLPLPLDRGAVRCRTANVRDGLREAGRAWAFCHCLKVPGVCVWGVGEVPSGAVRGWEGIQKAELEHPAPGSDLPAPGSGSLGPSSRRKSQSHLSTGLAELSADE